MISLATSAVENLNIPDPITRMGISLLVGRTSKNLASAPQSAEADFAENFKSFPIATHTDDANAQHYELPPAFFGLVLGPRRKYSSCLYDAGATTLEAAEIRALTETCRHARLEDGQSILELGCGWGSLTLWMAEHYPASHITAVSNSAPQRAHIESEAAARNLTNIKIITADMNVFAPTSIFDRIVSVEMFEHMSNWQALLTRIRTWLAPNGRLFIHVFAHKSAPYRFDHTNNADWIAKYFFTGGIMPSHGLIHRFQNLFTVEQEWRWSGDHYQRTANDWLANYDRHEPEIKKLLEGVYADQAPIWQRRWRLFFLATAGLFGYRQGQEWGVSHYFLKPAD